MTSRKVKYSPVKRSTAVDYEDILPLATAKLHLRMDHDDDDNIIAVYRDAAMRTAEHETNRLTGSGEFTVYFDTIPGEEIFMKIPALPIASISAVQYHDGTDWQNIQASSYVADLYSEPCRIKFLTDDFATGDTEAMPFRIIFSGGYTDETVPKEMISGALLLLGHLYENRQDVVTGTISTQLPKGSEFLFQQLRIVY